MALAKDKKQETKSVKVRLLDESGNRPSFAPNLASSGGASEGLSPGPSMEVPVVIRSDKEWANRLTLEQFRIGRTHGTERAFCGVFHDTKKNGVYSCAGCGLPLFKSDDKFDSGTCFPIACGP